MDAAAEALGAAPTRECAFERWKGPARDLTGTMPGRIARGVPVTTTKPVLRLAPKTKREFWELQEVLVQLFTVAAVEDLTPTPEDRPRPPAIKPTTG